MLVYGSLDLSRIYQLSHSVMAFFHLAVFIKIFSVLPLLHHCLHSTLVPIADDKCTVLFNHNNIKFDIIIKVFVLVFVTQIIL
jgi:hypothetical protein